MDAHALSLFQAFRDATAVRRRRALYRAFVAFSIVKSVFLVVCLALTALALWIDWPRLLHMEIARRGPSDPLIGMVIVSLEVFMWLQVAHLNALERVLGSDGKPQSSTAYARALTNVIVARDPALAPDASDSQSEAPPPDDSALAPNSAEAIAPLASPARALVGSSGVYVALGALGGVGLIALGAGLALAPTQITGDHALLPIGAPNIVTWVQAAEVPITAELMGCALALIGVFLGIWALINWRYARAAHSDFSALVDAEGLVVRASGAPEDERRLLWSEIRGFARIRYKDASLRTHDVYLLCDGSTDVLWEAPPVSRYVAPARIQREEAQRASALRLAALVSHRITPPLVDVTETIETTLIGTRGALDPYAWSFPERVRFVALDAGDSALARELWAYLYPGKRAPSESAVWTRIAVRSRRVPGLRANQRQAVLRVARAWLPYLPTDEQLGITPRARALRRAYWRFEAGVVWFAAAWALTLVIPLAVRLSAHLY